MQIFNDNHKSSKTNLIITDIFIITLVYFTSYFLKTSSLEAQTNYLVLYSLIIFYWIALSIYYKKYKHYANKYRSLFLRSTLWVTSFSIFFITLTMSLTGMLNISRLFFLQTIFILLGIELLMGFIFTGGYISQFTDTPVENTKKKSNNFVKIKYIGPS